VDTVYASFSSVSLEVERAVNFRVQRTRRPFPILVVFFARKQSRQGWGNSILSRLLVGLEVRVMMMVVVVVVVMDHHDDLRLRRVG
jgi:hypothetical protein